MCFLLFELCVVPAGLPTELAKLSDKEEENDEEDDDKEGEDDHGKGVAQTDELHEHFDALSSCNTPWFELSAGDIIQPVFEI